uniref:MD-2-related lipid-recognition domain-containing protein n=1 Tax=Acrobeloides nanus TaxID=290746 RepID=A0A914D199_9BILA
MCSFKAMHKILVAFSLFAALSSGVFGDCTWPNGTDTTFHWWQDASSVFTTYSVYTTDTSGNPEYPIHLSLPLIAVLNATVTGSTISQIREDIALAEWDATNCKWNTLPTFGLLNNLDGCTNGLACPIPTGNQIIKMTVDFSKFQAIINLLKNDAPYQLQFTLTNKQTGDKIVLTSQARAEIK